MGLCVLYAWWLSGQNLESYLLEQRGTLGHAFYLTEPVFFPVQWAQWLFATSEDCFKV